MQEEPTLHQLISQFKKSMNKKPQIVAQSSKQDKKDKEKKAKFLVPVSRTLKNEMVPYNPTSNQT